MTKLEEVARAICAANDFSKWCGCGGKCDDMQNRARAAIKAMKGPTEEMTSVGQFAPSHAVSGAGRANATYEAMIDAALEGK